MSRPLLLSALTAILTVTGPQNAAEAQTWELSVQRLMSALRVDTAQVSTKAQQATNGFAVAAQAAASTITSQDNALRIARAQHTYGYDTGTGYAACTVALSMSAERDAYTSAQKVRDAFRKSDQQWLNGGGDGAERIANSLKLRREFYCTQAEQEAGWCKKTGGGGIGAGDSDAAPWLLRCLVPPCGDTSGATWRDALWARFSTAAPQRQRRSVGQSKLVKRA